MDAFSFVTLCRISSPDYRSSYMVWLMRSSLAAALGLVGMLPILEWGAMLGDSYKYLSSGAWWAVLFPVGFGDYV